MPAGMSHGAIASGRAPPTRRGRKACGGRPAVGHRSGSVPRLRRICAAVCPEMAVRHSLTDEAIYGCMRLLMEGVEWPVLGFYCKECAGVAVSLSGMRHDSYPVNVRLVELPCLGRVSALHIIEAARLGARGVFLAGCAQGRCQFRKGDVNAAEQARQRAAVPDRRRHQHPHRSLASLRRGPPLRRPPESGCPVARPEVTTMTEILFRLDPSAGIANGGGVPGVLPVAPVYVGLSERVGSQPGPATRDQAAAVRGHRQDPRL